MARRSRSSYRHAAVALLATGGTLGCALVVGVDFDAARLAAQDGGRSSEDDGGRAEPVEAGSCAPGEKRCNGACVSRTDPEYGCGGPECTPCSLALATGSACGADGTCIPNGCAAGFDDCDRDPANGCETDLTRPESCGSCGTKCTGGMFCAPTGCVAECPGALVACNKSCVDTKTASAHCGGCGQACDGGANADPACAGGACQLACRPGFGDCAASPPKACAALPKWYVDGDGDDAGAAAFVVACTRPVGHVSTTGYGLDTNLKVRPGAPASDVPYAGPNGPSYDYDCNGVEVEEGDPPPPHFPGSCGPGCDQGGWLPVEPPRAGAGVNNHCGTSMFHLCFNFDGCSSGPFDAGTRLKCN